jgi:hypothetical protein
LSDLEAFSPEVSGQLASLWITTAEEFISTADESGTQSLADFLDLSTGQVDDLLAAARAAVPDFRPLPEGGIVEFFGLGALDEEEGADPDQAPDASFREPLPPSANLIEHMPPVRNQRGRGTCVAHACTAVREFLLGQDSTGGDLSEQYLYWACKQRDGHNGAGTWIHVGMAVLEDLGICPEVVWPYVPDPIPGNEGQGPPPATAGGEASQFRIGSSSKMQPRWEADLRQALAGGKPVAFSVPVYKYWQTQPVRNSGDIRMPLPSDENIGGHAMCLVGYQDDPDVPGGGFFLVRNSWGTGWAANSAVAPGYARLPYAYMTSFGRAAYTASMPAPGDDKPGEETAGSWLERLLKRLLG